MHPLIGLHRSLRTAGMILDIAASQIRDERLEPVRENIGKIGETLALIYEIQDRIYQQAPELNLERSYEKPPEELRQANRRLGEALLLADDLATSGKWEEARALLAEYASTEASLNHGDLARAQINRYTEPGKT
jgi:hypothetical protein